MTPVHTTSWRTTRTALTGALAGMLMSAAAPVLADPGYYLVRPYSEPGETTLDLRYWSVKAPGDSATLWPEAGVRHGFTSRWSSELLFSWIGPEWHRQTLSAINWINQYIVTDGSQPYDLALHVQLIRNRGDGNAIEIGPALQTEWGLTQFNLNLFWEHDSAARRQNRPKLQWQALHRWQAGWRAGVQGFAEPQSWRAGPVARVDLPGGVEVQAAYLWGNTYRSRGDMFSAHLQWAF
ncbi:MAG: hypothetical protein ABW220_00440 [Burkholderiaceae bacterium]